MKNKWNRTYEDLHESLYHLTVGTKLFNHLDPSLLPVMIAELVCCIQPRTQQLEPLVKQLDTHMGMESDDDSDFLY